MPVEKHMFVVTAAQAERWGCPEYVGFQAVARPGGVWVRVGGVDVDRVAGEVTASSSIADAGFAGTPPVERS